MTPAHEPDWAKIHSSDQSWRKKIVGNFSELFTIPRYVKFFYSYFGSDKNLTFIEFGSGTGDISAAIIRASQGQIKSYVLSEQFEQGVKWLKEKGFDAVKLDACNTSLPTQSYDVTVSLDVMHHVDRPQEMAREMLRVGRGKCFLVESNGLSVFRKIMELTPGHRAAGEKSYLPRTWRSFFDLQEDFTIKRIEVTPFLFAFKVPDFLLVPLLWFNQFIERVPILKWQCASLAIYIEYEPKKSNS